MKALLMVGVFLFSSASMAIECFDKNRVFNWKYDNFEDVLEVETYTNTYVVDVSFSCTELAWAHAIDFKTFGGSNSVCAGDDVVVYSFGQKPSQICRIFSVKKIK